MNLNEEIIRMYQAKGPLPSEEIKTSREFYALAVLKYSYPEKFSGLRKMEAPDLQDISNGIGIEVTWGGSPRDAVITGENAKYSRSKTAEDREKSLRIIRRNGGERNEYSISYPVSTADGDIKNLRNVFIKKVKKAEMYKKSFPVLGLAVLMDIPLFFFEGLSWGEGLEELNGDAFDFVTLIHWSGVDTYWFDGNNYSSNIISRDDMDALKKLGRMTAEGIIDEDDTVWL